MMILKKNSKALIINKRIWCYKKILISEKEFTKINYERLKILVYIKISLIDSKGNIYLTVGSLIEMNNIITGSNSITLRKVDLKPYRFDKMYMDKNLTENCYYILSHKV